MSRTNNLLYKQLPILSALIYIVLTGIVVLFSNNATALTDENKQSLIYLLKQDCGSCHGLTLKGGLGPALLKQHLQNKSKAYLEAVIKYGRTGTAMPPWKDILKDEEISFLAEYLLSDKNVIADTVLNKSHKHTNTSQKNSHIEDKE
ncbi:c-type cytochrome [Aliikangiella sp. IMCC44359]|uniref:c-type cytochrome n=1 Tax=Aliikangiella sp. IMCC44359 TaxID=3459125 RepID=UPI00403B1A08